MKYYMIDNNDSFVYNLAAYFKYLGHQIIVRNVKEVYIDEIDSNEIKGIIISPGPGKPEGAAVSKKVLQIYAGQIPILGVCLGHQIIGHCFGATVKKGLRPMHGKISKVNHTGIKLFRKLPKKIRVTRYHSLVIDRGTLPLEFTIDATTEDNEIMAISHGRYPIYGVQFHPEAVLTEYGYEIPHNFAYLCKVWR